MPALLFLATAIVLRVWMIGNPVVHIDEQFYLLVGDRMWSGVLPYVDIWDRKPIGLFLIYAFAGMLGDGLVQYQWMALLSAAATALVIYRTALRIATPNGAIVAGIAYLLYLSVFNGAGGQSPIFYNLPVTIAVLMTLKVMTARSAEPLLTRGAGAMLLLGLAMQIKYTVMFEGAFLGCALLWRGVRDGRPVGVLAGMASVWIGCALLPTLAALAVYGAMGQTDAFLQANFFSIFGKQAPLLPALGRLAVTALILLPFWLAIFVGPRVLTRPEATPHAWHLLAGWAIAAVGGYLILGSYGDHYAQALIPSLAVVAAPMLGHPGRGRWFTVPILLLGLLIGSVATYIRWQDHGSRAQVDRATALIRPLLKGGCMFLLDGDPILYKTTGACFASRFVFTSHLTNITEAQALGVDVHVETRRILATEPDVIAMIAAPQSPMNNESTRYIVQRFVRKYYVLAAQTQIGVKTYLIYRRKPRAAAAS